MSSISHLGQTRSKPITTQYRSIGEWHYKGFPFCSGNPYKRLTNLINNAQVDLSVFSDFDEGEPINCLYCYDRPAIQTDVGCERCMYLFGFYKDATALVADMLDSEGTSNIIDQRDHDRAKEILLQDKQILHLLHDKTLNSCDYWTMREIWNRFRALVPPQFTSEAKMSEM